jgi:phospho-N-acetylmuramoyl-pentapeptide-transferase
MDRVSFFRVFRYPSFRILGAALTALILTLWLFPWFIERLRLLQQGVSNVREDVPGTHQTKKGTPTMGGLFILLVVGLSALLWADIANVYVWAVLMVMFGFGAIGFVDDYRKVVRKNSKGLGGKYKLGWQVLVLTVVALFLWAAHHGFWLGGHTVGGFSTELTLPFVSVKSFDWHAPWFLYVPFAYLVVMGTSHGLNLTDGLDGLAIGPTVVSSMTFLLLSYVAGLVLRFNSNGVWVDFNVAQYLNIAYVSGTSELAVVCAAIVGAGIGFLWYNTFPASVFMGDVGSLALGGTLGTIAVLTKNEFLSCIIHGVFLVEALSVITQVASFQLTGKRVFRMAPIHHHFELKGWAEPKIIVRFWIISIILALVALTSLKLR